MTAPHPTAAAPDGLRAALAAAPVIAILRATSATRLAEVTDTLLASGVRAAEFTLTTPGVLDALREYAADAPPGLALGAGTVTTPAEAQAAVEAGATYLITPTTSVEVIKEAVRLGVPVLPGAYTPTEILTAWRAGATMVKLFPAATGGRIPPRRPRPAARRAARADRRHRRRGRPRLPRRRSHRARHRQPPRRRRLRGRLPRGPRRPRGRLPRRDTPGRDTPQRNTPGRDTPRRGGSMKRGSPAALVTLGEAMAVAAATEPGPLATGTPSASAGPAPRRPSPSASAASAIRPPGPAASATTPPEP